MSQCSSQPAVGTGVQLGKKVHFLLLLELSYFRHTQAKMPEHRAVKQCDSCHLHLRLSVLFPDPRMESCCFSSREGARFRKLRPGGPAEDALLLPLGTETSGVTLKALTPDGTKGNKMDLGALLNHGAAFKCPPYLAEWNHWEFGQSDTTPGDRDNKFLYQLFHLRLLQFFENFYLQLCSGWCHCSQVQMSTSD